MTLDLTVTKELPAIPPRRDDVHKGNVGRIAVIGGCDHDTLMVGAPALAANAALRAGAGLVQILLSAPLRASAAVLAPCATTRTLPTETEALLRAVEEFGADVVALGPGLGRTLDAGVVRGFLERFEGRTVVDADALNHLASASPPIRMDASRYVLTPHPGEATRMLNARGRAAVGTTAMERREASCALVELYGGTVVLKGRQTVVTNGARLYVNETGNAGMASGGTGDVLTGVIAALIGQSMEPFEAAILGVYLHGLAGDFAAEELGRCSMTALDLIDYLPESFCDYELTYAE